MHQTLAQVCIRNKMNAMKFSLTQLLIVFTLLFSLKNYAQNTITSDDLNILLGEWTGTLTYTDYSSNEPFTMPANLVVKQGKNKNQLLLFINYPKEPNANSKDKIRISKNGSQLNNIDVKSKQRLSEGQVQIITEYSGKDNNKKALIKNVYILGGNQFIIRKEVNFENSEDWLIRNEYKYER